MKITSVDWFRMSMIASAVSVCYLLPRLIQEQLWIHVGIASFAAALIITALRLWSETNKIRDRKWVNGILAHTATPDAAAEFINQMNVEGYSSIRATVTEEERPNE